MTNNLGTSTPNVGGDFDVWGDEYVADQAILNKMAGAAYVITSTGGTVVLDVIMCQNFALQTTGGTAVQVDVRVPDGISRFWWARNDRASGVTTYRNAAGGDTVSIPAGERRLIYSDGTDVMDLTLLSLAISSVSGLAAALAVLTAGVAGAQPAFTPATLAQILANTADKIIDTDGAWSSAVPVDLGNLTGAVTPDFATFVNAKAALTGNITLGLPTNYGKKGQSGIIEITHSGAARILAVNTAYWSTPNGAAIVLSTSGAGVADRLGYYIQDNGKILLFIVALAVA